MTWTKERMARTNERAVFLQQRIITLTNRINGESNHRKLVALYDELEGATEEFVFELALLPRAAKQQDERGNLLPWKEKI